ncbi:hypothetical protein A3Q56_04484 [Intoshia linei]|uniref:Ion transport domain-containing protein n=1 Tax=Intoshia linei TaxID=1819745 RepID=A0A177B0Z3_9BILA|nr:hypothetical protein A3Q56_04484 [Intoshia linei]
MGSIFSKNKIHQLDNDSAWKQQNKDQEENKMYKLINLKQSGEFIKLYRNIPRECFEKYLLDEIQSYMYNNGKGGLLDNHHLLEWRIITMMRLTGMNRESASIQCSKNTHIEYNGKHEVCWDLDQRGSMGETPLHLCLLFNDPEFNEIASVLLRIYPKLGLDFYENDEYYGEACLHLAIVANNFTLVRILIELGVDINQRAMGNFFLPEDQKHNFDPKKTDYMGYAYYGEYPLSFAACFENDQIYTYLLDHGANPDLQDLYGNTVVHLLVIHNKSDMLNFVVKHELMPASLEIKNKAGYSPITLSCRLGRNEMFRELIDIKSYEIWRYSNITCLQYSLASIDSIKVNGELDGQSALIYITDGETTDHLEMLQGGVLSQLLDEKWKIYARKRFFIRFLFAILYLIVMSVSIYLRTDNNLFMVISRYDVDFVRTLFEFFLLLMVIIYIFLEFQEIFILGIKGYILGCLDTPAKSAFRISCVMILTAAIFRIFHLKMAEVIILSLAIPLSWLYLLYFARASTNIGYVVLMIFQILRYDIFRFLVIILIFIIQFGLCFYFLFKSLKNLSTTSYKNLSGTLIEMIKMIYGEFKIDDFDNVLYTNTVKIVFTIFAILVPVLLMNMLIAMMGNTYQSIIKNVRMEQKRQWAKIVISLERTFNKKDLIKFQKQYSVKGMNDDNNYLLVVKTSTITKAKERLMAFSNWKNLIKLVSSNMAKLKFNKSNDCKPSAPAIKLSVDQPDSQILNLNASYYNEMKRRISNSINSKIDKSNSHAYESDNSDSTEVIFIDGN